MPFFDNFFLDAPTKLGDYLQRTKADRAIEILSNYHKANFSVVEVGPGWGEFAIGLKARGHDYVGLEGNMVQASELNAAGILCVNALVPPVPMRSESMDVAFASNVLEHMNHLSRALEFIQELVRVIKPGGFVCINCPDLLHYGPLFWDADYTHNFPVTKNRLHQLFKDAGLQVVFVAYFSGPVHGRMATPISWLARIFPEAIVSWLFKPFINPIRVRRLRLTFLRNVFVIGQK